MQFGKYFSVQYDLHVKHTFFYQLDDIDIGVEIIPMHSLMKQMSTGVAWYENELTNIVREGRSNPTVLIILIGLTE
ncbi:BglII/BstYI family type II restriction endonuclease [Helicobacter cappadocius]|uniref:BglII/BstYI family type II restriction endonuclease n=1 Tax=Helicobacter cappadocius TaxID=3063998 RepID=UPI00351DDD6C